MKGTIALLLLACRAAQMHVTSSTITFINSLYLICDAFTNSGTLNVVAPLRYATSVPHVCVSYYYITRISCHPPGPCG